MTKELIERLRNHANWECRDPEAADAIESLQAENERLKAANAANIITAKSILNDVTAERNALAAKLATVEADAKRYRWLRRFDHFSRVDELLNRNDINTLDAAIDAAKGGQHD